MLSDSDSDSNGLSKALNRKNHKKDIDKKRNKKIKTKIWHTHTCAYLELSIRNGLRRQPSCMQAMAAQSHKGKHDRWKKKPIQRRQAFVVVLFRRRETELKCSVGYETILEIIMRQNNRQYETYSPCPSGVAAI